MSKAEECWRKNVSKMKTDRHGGRPSEWGIRFYTGCLSEFHCLMERFVGRRCVRSQSGQGTTEYAILVGILVVIAIVAVTAFKGKLQELWDSIATGINGL